MEIPYTVKPRPDTGLYNAKIGIWLFLASEVMLFGALFSSYILLRVGADPGTWPMGLLNIPIGTFNTGVLIGSSVTVLHAWAALKMGNLARFRMFMGITCLCALAFLAIKSIEYKDKFTHYQVWLNDGSTYTGHLEGDPWFWKTSTLDDKGLSEIKFTLDGHTVKGPGGESHVDSHAEESHGGDGHHETKIIQRDNIKRLSAFVPAHSTYFAIYFTLTGLHALHVIGGALVLAYFMGPGISMWKTDPERLTNRVEVGGLFWHFVDLVWIFLFPILYLL